MVNPQNPRKDREENSVQSIATNKLVVVGSNLHPIPTGFWPRAFPKSTGLSLEYRISPKQRSRQLRSTRLGKSHLQYGKFDKTEFFVK